MLAGVFVLEFAQTWISQTIGQGIMFEMRMAIYGHLQRVDVAFYDRHAVGRLMTRVTSDVDALNDLFSAGVVAVFGDAFMLAGIVGVVLWMDWRLALITFSVLPLIVLVTQWFRRHVRESYRRVRGWVARINAFLQENLTGMATVQLFRREALNFERFAAINRGHRDANVEAIFYYAVFYPAIEGVASLAAALIIVAGGHWVGTGTLTIGALVAFLQYAQRFFRPISDMSEKFNLLQAAMASSERIFTLLDTPVTIASPAGADAAAGRRARPHRLRSRLVRLRRRRRDRRLRPRRTGRRQLGAARRLVRGAGRAAGRHRRRHRRRQDHDHQPAAALLRRPARPHPGRRRRHPRARSRRAARHLRPGAAGRLSVLGQHRRQRPPRPAASCRATQVERAVAAVHADRFVAALPEGLDTQVGERGASLSVGQKQLLSFARALAGDPAVLVLDEATSSVDTETELLIRDALHVLMAGRTTIAIAHRLSTIQDVDRILVFHRGELRESGSHQELLAQRGLYERLYQLQYRDQGARGQAGLRASTSSELPIGRSVRRRARASSDSTAVSAPLTGAAGTAISVVSVSGRAAPRNRCQPRVASISGNRLKLV